MSELIDKVSEIWFETEKYYYTYYECKEEEDYEYALEELSKVQNEVVAKVLKECEEFCRKVRELGFECYVVDNCVEYDSCYIDVLLFVVRDNMVYQVLVTNFQFNIIETDDVVTFDVTYRTAIHVPEEPFPVKYIHTGNNYLEFNYVPDSPEKEIIEEIEIEE